MSCLPQQQVDQLKAFIKLLEAKPAVLHDPALAFFRDYIKKLHGIIPSPTEGKKQDPQPEPMEPDVDVPEQTTESGEDQESDLDLDMSGVIEPDNDPPQPMGHESPEVSEEALEAFDAKRAEAMAAFSDADWQKACDILTEAILLNPSSAAMFAKRGNCFLKLKKPNACIRDCDRAIQLNPDSAPAHKFRGRAHRLLGHFEEAARDLRLACKIDYDEMADEWLREVTPNAKKIEEYERKKQRKMEEKELKEKKERIQKAKEAREKAAKEAEEANKGEKCGSGMPGGLGGLLNDPELLTAFSDPDVSAAFQDISTNPANIAKYQNNPKVMALINKMASKFGGAGGIGGMPGFPGMGGVPGMGGMAGGPRKDATPGGGKPPSSTEDLD